MPVTGWDVPDNYYDPDIEEPESQMNTPTPTYLDRLRADVAFADAHGPMQNHEPVTDSSLTYGDLREMLLILSEIDAPFSDEEQTMIDLAWEKHKAAAPVAGAARRGDDSE